MPARERVEVTIARTDAQATPPVRRLWELLDDGERQRARRLRQPLAFVTARAAARVVLGRHLGLAPADVSIREGPHGKPLLAGDGPHFNVSHTHGIVAVAVRDAAPVGVDVETTRRRVPRTRLLRKALSDRERAALGTPAAGAPARRLLEVWTRKEAYVKGLGVGLALDLGALDAGWEDGVLAAPGRSPWEVRRLPLPAPHVGAVAARGEGWALKVERLSW
jgi:4'-phosphopantetheinyl transferase